MLQDRVDSLKIHRKISPVLKEWNAMFNKTELLKSCLCKGILKYAVALAEADGVNHAIFEIFFSSLLEAIISHKTISTFFMSNGQWLQRNWKAEVQESDKRRLTWCTKDKISTFLVLPLNMCQQA